MEKLTQYRQIIRELLTAHASTNEPNIECQLIFDTEHDHYSGNRMSEVYRSLVQ